MGRKRASEIDTDTAELEPDEIPQDTVEERLERDSSLEIEEVLRRNDISGGTVKIERRRKGDVESEVLHTKLPIKDFDLESIRKSYPGGGLFRFVFRTAGGTILTCKEIRFAEDPVAPVQTNGDAKLDKLTELLSQNQKGDPNSILLAMMQMQQAQMEAQRQQQQAQLEAQRQHSQEMMALVTQALKQPAPTPQPSVVDQLAKLLGAAAPVLDFLKSKGSGMKEALETIQLAKNIGGGEGGENSTLDKLLTAAAPMIVQRLGQAQAQPAQPTVTVGPAEPAKDKPAALPDAAPAEITDPAMIKQFIIRELRQLYPQLAKHAAKGTDPVAFYNVWAADLEDRPKLALNALAELLAQPNWCEVIFGQPTLSNQQWFEQVRTLIVEEFGPEPEEPATTVEEKTATFDNTGIPASMPTPNTGRSEKPKAEPKGGKK